MALLKKISIADSSENSELCIPAGTVFSGNIASKSNARINGVIEGNVLSENGNILFGVSSNISGNVNGKDIAVGGSIRGDIHSSGQISILAGAKVLGDISASALVVEKDAVYEGNAKINSSEKQQIGASGSGKLKLS